MMDASNRSQSFQRNAPRPPPVVVPPTPENDHQSTASSPTATQNYNHIMPMYPPFPPYGFPPPPPPPPYGGAPPFNYHPNHEFEWATGVCGCLLDVKLSLFVLFCPCVAFGKMAEIINEGETYWLEPGVLYLCLYMMDGGINEAVNTIWYLILGRPCPCYTGIYGGWMIGVVLSILYSGLYRNKMRSQFHLKGKCIGDYCIHLLCHPCALCQEYRQLEHQGFRVFLGWEHNKERRRRAMAAMYPYAPPMVQEMSR